MTPFSVAPRSLPATPVFLNPRATQAERVLSLLGQDRRLELHELEPDALLEALDMAVKLGAPRVIVAGGDGTVALAASQLVGQSTELALLPAGRSNAFARQLGLPVDARAAIELALQGTASLQPVAYVNERVFVHRSVLGVDSQRGGFFARLRRLLATRSVSLEPPLSFLPSRCALLELRPAQQTLQLRAIGSAAGWQDLRRAARAILLGIDPLEAESTLLQAQLQHLELSLKGSPRSLAVKVDGEWQSLTLPLIFRYSPAALRLVTQP